MSWFSSIFSSSKSTSSSPPTVEPATEKRLLEESAPSKPSVSSQPPREPASSSQPTTAPQPPTTEPAPKIYTTTTAPERRNRNPLLFTAGAVFFAASLIITRRALARRRLATMPAYYTNAHTHVESEAKTYLGQKEALEALNLATINVLSLAMMVTGGTLWYLDINSREDLRRRVRGTMVIKEGEGDAGDREIEEWLERNLGRKEGEGERKGNEGKDGKDGRR